MSVLIKAGYCYSSVFTINCAENDSPFCRLYWRILEEIIKQDLTGFFRYMSAFTMNTYIVEFQAFAFI